MVLRRAQRLSVERGRRRLLRAQRAGARARQDRRAGGARIDAAARARWPRSAGSWRCMSRRPARSISTSPRCRRRRSSASATCCASRRAPAARPRRSSSKMVEGRLRKFYEEVVLLEQIFVDRRRDAGSARWSRRRPRRRARRSGRRLRPLCARRGHRAADRPISPPRSAAQLKQLRRSRGRRRRRALRDEAGRQMRTARARGLV